MKEVEIFAVRCFLGEKRKLTHKLTKREAKLFHWAAHNLAGYLKREYKLGEIEQFGQMSNQING